MSLVSYLSRRGKDIIACDVPSLRLTVLEGDVQMTVEKAQSRHIPCQCKQETHKHGAKRLVLKAR